MFQNHDTIVALSTAQGVGAIAVIRLSGEDAFTITNKIFKGKDLRHVPSHTVHFGYIMDNEIIVDEVVATVFKGPNSFTKENIVEISCHGSDFIVRQVMKLLIKAGARSAKPGEFTQRAFMNGRFDLAQAEAVADLIAADTEASHRAAMTQMRGGFSQQIKALRNELIHFASMIELELDFSEEDVEFASRLDLKNLIYNILNVVNPLLQSFELGNVIKNGVPTVIAGKPNAGKSTLLNALLNEDRAIVSEIAGTTRDTIEDEVNVGGIIFRFIDTAGLRDTEDKLEAIGIEKTRQKMKDASLIIYLFDVNSINPEDLKVAVEEIDELNIPHLLVGNKIDQAEEGLQYRFHELSKNHNLILISASEKKGIDQLKQQLLKTVKADTFRQGNTVVTNVRHYESLSNTAAALERVITGIDNGITGDFLAMDIRQSLFHLGEITGEITTEDLLDNIFSKFCIGK